MALQEWEKYRLTVLKDKLKMVADLSSNYVGRTTLNEIEEDLLNEIRKLEAKSGT